MGVTFEDTIESIKELKVYNKNGELTTPVNKGVSMWWDGVFGKVLDCFKEIQQYRAIDMVENLQALKEKVERIESLLRCHDDYDLFTSQKNYELVKAVRRILEIEEDVKRKSNTSQSNILQELHKTQVTLHSKAVLDAKTNPEHPTISQYSLEAVNMALEEIWRLQEENAELHCELQAQNALLSERDAAIEEDAIARFVNWVDDHYNTEIHLERADEYKSIHDFHEEFIDEQQEEERD